MPSQRRKPTKPTPPSDVRCVIYTRVSSKDQAQEGWSLDAQVRSLRAYAQERGLSIEAELVEDETAKRPGRREFSRMIELIAKGKVTDVIVEKVDRLYRNFKDQVSLGEHIDSGAVRVHFVTTREILHKDSPAHVKLMHDFQLVLAKNYIDNLRQEAIKGMREKARQGHWPSRAPIGYRNVVSGHKRVIEPDPTTAPLVRRLYQAYADGAVSLRDLGSYAATLGLRNANGRQMNAASVQWILRNPIYKGVVLWDNEETAGVHTPLVDRDLWSRVQAIMEGRKDNVGGGTGKADYAYKGLVRCGVCGCTATPYMAKGIYVYYACTGARGCRRAGVREEILTNAIAKQLEGLRIRPSEMEYLKAALRESHALMRAEQEERRQILEKERAKVYDRLDRLYMDRINGDVPHSTYNRMKPQWEEELAAADRALADLSRASITTWDENVALLEAVSNCSNTFKEARKEHRRAMLKHMVSNFEIVEGEVRVELRPWFKSVFVANLQVVEGGSQIDQESIWWTVLDGLRTGEVAAMAA